MQGRLALSCDLVPTWVQTCWFAIDGHAPCEEETAAYVDFPGGFAGRVRGVHLYGIARPSMQPAAGRLTRLGGTATVRSAPGEGTEVELVLQTRNPGHVVEVVAALRALRGLVASAAVASSARAPGVATIWPRLKSGPLARTDASALGAGVVSGVGDMAISKRRSPCALPRQGRTALACGLVFQ